MKRNQERLWAPVLDAIAGWPLWLLIGMALLAGMALGVWIDGMLMHATWSG